MKEPLTLTERIVLAGIVVELAAMVTMAAILIVR